MDHSETVRSRVPERYLLNELAGGERSAFEEHFFTCEECAEEVRCGAILMENLREAIQNTAAAASRAPLVPVRRNSRTPWLYPVFA
jgi:anti-sigma factor RsiW